MLREVSREAISSAGGRTANRPSINLGYRFDYQSGFTPACAAASAARACRQPRFATRTADRRLITFSV
jgi:hypothetical protein